MNKKTVLIVDNEAEILEELGLTLKKYFRVLKASNGKEAWDLLKVWEVDCLVINIEMPKMSGAKLLEMMKTAHHTSHTIVMTERYSEETKKSCETLGVSDFFYKPFSARNLGERIEALIGE